MKRDWVLYVEVVVLTVLLLIGWAMAIAGML